MRDHRPAALYMIASDNHAQIKVCENNSASRNVKFSKKESMKDSRVGIDCYILELLGNANRIL
jgi:hypothetical protein